MQGDKEVINALNDVLTNELTAINQYFLHARICDNWGYKKIAGIIYKESIDEMKHSQAVIDRILLIEGLPNVQRLDTINIGETIEEIFKADLTLEMKAIPLLRESIELCYNKRDHGSRDLLEKILVDEENHQDWLESQLKIISDVGVENYLPEQIYEN